MPKFAPDPLRFYPRAPSMSCNLLCATAISSCHTTAAKRCAWTASRPTATTRPTAVLSFRSFVSFRSLCYVLRPNIWYHGIFSISTHLACGAMCIEYTACLFHEISASGSNVRQHACRGDHPCSQSLVNRLQNPLDAMRESV